MNPKVVGGAIGGAFTGILFWVLSAYAAVEVPAHVAAEVTMIVSTGIAWMVSETGAEIPVVGLPDEAEQAELADGK